MLPIVILTFIAVFLAIWAIYLTGTAIKESPKAELKRRLRMLTADKESHMPEYMRKDLVKDMPAMERLTSHIRFLMHINMLSEKSGVRLSLTQFSMVSALAMVFGVLLGLVIDRGFVPVITLAVLFSIIPYIYLLQKKKQRLDKFTEQFPDALMMMSRSLRVGHPLTSAMQMISQEMPEPTASLFRDAYDQQMLGIRLRDSLSSMGDRIDSIDFRFFVTTVNVHSEIGGNLAELLDKLGATIRERLRVKRQIRVYTAQARLSGYILAVLPLVAFFLLHFIILPGYGDLLIKTTMGNYMIAIAIMAQIVGFLFIRKIINIRI